MGLVWIWFLAVVVGLVGAGVAGITITVFLHRGLTHGAISLPRPLYTFGRWMTFLTVFMRHWEWRKVHRKHHMYTDIWIDEVRHDPHSPILIGADGKVDGFRRVAWHMAAIFHTEATLPDIIDDTYDQPNDRPLDRLDRAVFDHPVYGAIAAGVFYVALLVGIGPVVTGLDRTWWAEGVCLLAGLLSLGVHIWVMLRFGGAINSDCHKGKEFVEGAGYATNVGALSFLIFGEGEHLTHHRFPQLAQISARWDLGYRVIQVLQVFRLTKIRFPRATVFSR